MPVQQLVRCPQRATTGTKQAGGFVEEADRVEMILLRVEAEQHEANSHGQQGTRQSGQPGRLVWQPANGTRFGPERYCPQPQRVRTKRAAETYSSLPHQRELLRLGTAALRGQRPCPLGQRDERVPNGTTDVDML